MFADEGENIEKNTDIAIRCYKCGKEYNMDMMRMDTNGKNLVCRNCLERKPAEKTEQAKPARAALETKAGKIQEAQVEEYFCKKCKYNFTRAKHLVISTCPYCGASKSLMTKGSTAKIISDASRMKGDFEF